MDRGRDEPIIAQLGLACDMCDRLTSTGMEKETVPAAEWAVSWRECCNNDQVHGFFLCQQHWDQVRSPQFPATCVSCGTVRASLDDVVVVAGRLYGGTDIGEQR